ncbi:MAG TPA: hypothetical protein VK171_08965, partial [Fimbriimonas sp.]|nr:hypothetical protein [Fimbriimonas sp.]
HLLTLFESPRLSDKRRAMIQRIVLLRLRSATYIRNYAETLRSQEGGKHSLRQVPRSFAEPRWQNREDSKQRLGRQPEITFMEFSS